jgi:hypothetical protein
MNVKSGLLIGLVSFGVCLPEAAFAQEATAPIPQETSAPDTSGVPIDAPPVVVPPPAQAASVETPAATSNDDPWHVRTVYRPTVEQNSEHHAKFAAGIGADVGAPDGAAIGLLISPMLPWLKLGAFGTYNYMSEGLRGTIILDPINFPIAPTLSTDFGGYFPGTVPNVSKSPTFAYTYENLLLGLEIGSQRGFRMFLRGGATHMSLSADHLDRAFTLPNGATMTSANMEVWAPAAKLGFNWLF